MSLGHTFGVFAEAPGGLMHSLPVGRCMMHQLCVISSSLGLPRLPATTWATAQLLELETHGSSCSTETHHSAFPATKSAPGILSITSCTADSWWWRRGGPEGGKPGGGYSTSVGSFFSPAATAGSCISRTDKPFGSVRCL